MQKVIKVVCLSLIYLLFILRFFTNVFVGNPIIAILLGILFLLLAIVERKQNNAKYKMYLGVSGIVFLLAVFMILFPGAPLFSKGLLK
ncbi:hypothetical protein SAMN05444673_3190 [Bacillus sp. OV166]|uniref:hypothetical protein n=1 Tax=Bacillus sp. OV166 TaxID=1882763 RepID=UPI000A2AA59C|nr:hypothetical protein [Bacillus sp. OV166]SMQ78010.1 hypothetical protein SAMN05444673_3190 [Bacillus sp. OV166]